MIPCCPTCGQGVRDPAVARGIYINRIASAGARVVELRLRLRQPFAFPHQRAEAEEQLKRAETDRWLASEGLRDIDGATPHPAPEPHESR